MLRNMIFTTHFLPVILSLFCITTALSQPLYPSVVRSLGLRDFSYPLLDGWTVTLIRPGNIFLPIETASAHMDILYTHVIAVARAEHSLLAAAVAFRIGAFDLTFRADEATLSWATIENFCLLMRNEVKKGFPTEFEAVFTHEHFHSWVIWVNLRQDAGAN